ncbi:MAG: NifB/NifX family molybdenum-iron cluster-binding protein [Pseudomonadota bacterium]
MRYCFPIAKDQGLASKIFGHFGSAPLFLIVDADTGATELVEGPEHSEHHGGCRPVERLAGHAFDTLIVGGIGAGAIAKFHAIGKRVYLAQANTIQDNLDLLKSNSLPECDPAGACSDPGHAHGGGGCGHGHAHKAGQVFKN